MISVRSNWPVFAALIRKYVDSSIGHRTRRRAGAPLPLWGGTPEFVVHRQERGVAVLRARGPFLRRRVVGAPRVVERPVVVFRPFRLGHRGPRAVRAGPPLEEPVRL